MKKTILVLAWLVLVAPACGVAPNPAVAPVAVVTAPLDWSTPEGVLRLERSRHKADFFQLANKFETQLNKFHCGPTAAAVVLNALRLSGGKNLPFDPNGYDESFRPFLPKPDFEPRLAKYTQNAFYNAATNRVKSKAEVHGQPMEGAKGPDYGLQLRQLHRMLEAHGVASEIRVADNRLTDEQIKRELVANLGKSGDYVLVNYQRSAAGQTGGGHISPLGAYDQASDSFLILDVNPSNAPWVWMSAATLIRGMRTLDTVENRGYVLVSEKTR